MKTADAFRIINKCRRLFPELDFGGITLITMNDCEHRFDAGGVCINGEAIYVGIPDTNADNAVLMWLRYADFMKTLIHEAIHRYVYTTHGKHSGHGKKFQKACLKFGLDPYRETEHDDTVKKRIRKEKWGIGICKYMEKYPTYKLIDDEIFAMRTIKKANKSRMDKAKIKGKKNEKNR